MNSSEDITRNNLAIVLPAFNESGTIAQLCSELSNLAQFIIVVDDGSTDNTGALAAQSGAIVIVHASRSGKGAALRTGFAKALLLPVNWVATMDADGQHSAQDLTAIYKFAVENDLDLAIGSRSFQSNQMSLLRKLTNRSMTAAIKRLTGLSLADSQSGMRIFKSSCLKRMHLTSSHFEIETETILESARLKLKVDCFPVTTFERVSGQSRISHLNDTLRWLRLIFSFIARKK